VFLPELSVNIPPCVSLACLYVWRLWVCVCPGAPLCCIKIKLRSR